MLFIYRRENWVTDFLSWAETPGESEGWKEFPNREPGYMSPGAPGRWQALLYSWNTWVQQSPNVFFSKQHFPFIFQNHVYSRKCNLCTLESFNRHLSKYCMANTRSEFKKPPGAFLISDFFFLTSESESLKLLWKNPEQCRIFFSNYLPNSRGASSISNTQQPWRHIFGGAGHSKTALCAQGLPHWEPPQPIRLQQNWVSLDEFAALLVPADHPAQTLHDLTVSSPFKLTCCPLWGYIK